MRQLRIGNRLLTDKDIFVIAEIGSNHQGDPDLCEKMIITAAECGAHAVKLQKRDVNMFTKTQQLTPYANENSFGPTYGEHRRALDWFGEKEFIRLKSTAEKHGLVFFATPFDEEQALFLRNIGCSLWKIDSARAKTNLPFVRFVASFCDPMIISVGGMTLDEDLNLISEVDKINDQFAVMHCISEYPSEDASQQLRFIETLRHFTFPQKLIGFSSHHEGIDPVKYACVLGASIFEVHFTLRRAAKGTDNAFSLEPGGLRKLCEDLPRIRTMLGDGRRVITEKEQQGFVSKMGSGIYLNRAMHAGSMIREMDIIIRSPVQNGGFTANDTEKVVGRELVADCSTGINLKEEWLK